MLLKMCTAMRGVRRLFYTACTRVMHELHLYSVGEVSPFVLGADSDSFELITKTP